ncbi:MAG: JAB domain-containing protein [Thiohalomonadales bacterium]
MRTSIVQDSVGSYHIKHATKLEILELASNILQEKLKHYDGFSQPSQALDFLRYRLSKHDSERFCVLYVDSRNRLIKFDIAFKGTINGASVHPREIVKRALELNASGVIFAHNHPSGNTTASDADIKITRVLKDILSVIEVRVLDHIIVGDDTLSFAATGLL